MSNGTSTPPRATDRTPPARRGSQLGRLVVGDYVGQPAGEAAQAVRRAGLRPGLDRSFGLEAELLGTVVAQEPLAGDDLARNGMVTLYVAAPGMAREDEDGDERVAHSFNAAAASETPALALTEEVGGPQAATERPRVAQASSP
jgi:hypothetical protein